MNVCQNGLNQVMAIATLERCYNNPAVFEGVVKIRKGEAVKMMMGVSSIEKVKAIMHHFAQQVGFLLLEDYLSVLLLLFVEA